jgi:hypothetical protein
MVAFYHANGIAVLEGACFPNLTDCIRMAARLRQAESSVPQSLPLSGVQGVLPEGGECSLEVAGGPNDPAVGETHECEYGPGLTLTFTRRSHEEMLTILEGIISESSRNRGGGARQPSR